MENTGDDFFTKRGYALNRFSSVEWLGIWIGIVMPMVSALLYPTYMHSMQIAWVEWSRLLEAPFVLCEIFVILWASRAGMDSTKMWRALPVDVKIASGFLIFGVFASSFFISEYPLRSVTISMITAVHLLFAFSIFHLLRRANVQDFRPFLMLLGTGLISLAALTFWRFAFPPPASMVPGGVIEWASALPGFISVRHFGSWTGAVAAGFLAMLLLGDEKSRGSWIHGFYFLSAAMTVWSGTRAAILAMVVTAVILVTVNRRFPTIHTIGLTAVLTGSAMTAAWVLLPYDDPTFLLFTSFDATTASAMSGGRLDLWAATFQKWQTAPVLGLGSGSTFWEVYIGWPHTQPHNAVLQFLISWGIVGAVSALWLLGRALANVHVVAVHNASLLPFLAILYALLIMSLLEGMLHYPRFIMLIMVMFAAILAFDANSREKLSSSVG